MTFEELKNGEKFRFKDIPHQTFVKVCGHGFKIENGTQLIYVENFRLKEVVKWQ